MDKPTIDALAERVDYFPVVCPILYHEPRPLRAVSVTMFG